MKPFQWRRFVRLFKNIEHNRLGNKWAINTNILINVFVGRRRNRCDHQCARQRIRRDLYTHASSWRQKKSNKKTEGLSVTFARSSMTSVRWWVSMHIHYVRTYVMDACDVKRVECRRSVTRADMRLVAWCELLKFRVDHVIRHVGLSTFVRRHENHKWYVHRFLYSKQTLEYDGLSWVGRNQCRSEFVKMTWRTSVVKIWSDVTTQFNAGTMQ